MVNDKTVRIRKLKKDGSIDQSHVAFISETLLAGGRALFPVDGLYGYASIFKDNVLQHVPEGHDCEVLINGFRMLEEVSDLSKQQYDFLHRVWPEEVRVLLAGKSSGLVPVRFPRAKYALDIIEAAGRPLLFEPVAGIKGNAARFRSSLLDKYAGDDDVVLIIDTLCRPHPKPAVIDLSDGHLRIIEEGRVSTEELKSLYFLDRENSA